METQEKSIIENVGQFIRKSVTLKLLSIFVLMLLLMIPMEFVRSLIYERETYRQTAIAEVSNEWANEQHLYGPVLTIPIQKQVIIDDKAKIVREQVHLLPSLLNIEGNIEPKSLKRGIYEVVVYDSKISFTGSYKGIQKYLKELKGYELLWDEAFLTVNISDLRGIKDKVQINWNGREIYVEPGSRIPALIGSGVTADNLNLGVSDTSMLNFSFDLHLHGSRYLGFLPMGKETNVKLSSTWPDPSFTGSFLPDDRTVTKNGFNAFYKILELNRNYPQFWIGDMNIENIRESDFGVNLLLPMNDYQKSTRSVKYALLAIALTFLTFFLVEIFNRKKVHPFQYILIGLAMCMFYTLLISISEHTNFDIAYLISSLSVITLIGLYAKAILESIKQTIVFVGVMALTYLFVYITIQLQDYALLIGSLGLTSILALTMYITRKINWYDLSAVRD
jgi:inner membrane protein